MDDIILGLRRATKTVWNREDAKSNGFRLSDGEPGYDKTNHVIKIGDGVSKFADLPSIGGGTSFDGGNINNSATILADRASDIKYWGIQYIDDTGATQHFRMNANNNSDYLSLTSSDSRIGTIISVKYNGTSTQFRGSVSNANTITLKQSNIYTTTSSTAGSYGLALKNSDIIGANALIFADECEANSEGILFPKQNIMSDVGVARSASDFYNLRAYRGELYFENNQVIHTGTKTSWMLDSSLNLDATDGTWRGYQIRYTVPGTSTQYNYYIGANSKTGYLNLASNNPDIGDILRCKMDGSEKIFNGNANTATRLATSRTISLTGNVTGSTSTNLSENVSISTTIANVPASKITETLPVAHGGTGGTSAAAARTNLQLFTEGANRLAISNYNICWGRFSSGTNFAVAATGNLWYQDCTLSSVISFPITFSSIPKIFFGVSSPTAEVVCIEPLSVTTTGISKVRIKRTTNTKTSISINWIAIGTT